ncbi:MAG: PRC-barrel domain-containing protein [Paracoccus sp. (in: a-proteobacteria)]|nr:PRC-barrel domain-containing protein [Paracoccus sp. (in: a-proteobacteria)]
MIRPPLRHVILAGGIALAPLTGLAETPSPPVIIPAAPEVVVTEPEPAPAPVAVLSVEAPGMLAGWAIGRTLWNAPEGLPATPPETRPEGWAEVARIDDLIIAPDGQVAGYLLDSGGFLGLGARKVVLPADQLQVIGIGENSYFVTTHSQDEVKALPELDATVLRR